jgi:hypothetical protein
LCRLTCFWKLSNNPLLACKLPFFIAAVKLHYLPNPPTSGNPFCASSSSHTCKVFQSFSGSDHDSSHKKFSHLMEP